MATYIITYTSIFGGLVVTLIIVLAIIVLIRNSRKPKIQVQKERLDHTNTPQPQISPKIANQNIKVDIKKEPTISIESNFVETPKTVSEISNELPNAKAESNKQISQLLFVNYSLDIHECSESYPIIRIPRKNCVIRSYRLGSTKRRSYKEESFQESINKYFTTNYIICGNVRLNTGKNTRPYEPDIALISKTQINIRIDIEIDEPYAAISRQPIHCIGEDQMRDIYFTDRGWIVIRFSEHQVHTQEFECLKYLALILNKIDPNFTIPMELNRPLILKSEKVWDIIQAQKWEKEFYRETYLNHRFIATQERKETIERDFNNQELEEERLVTPSLIGKLDIKKAIGYNAVNSHARDCRIKFYPEPHIYTIDDIPAYAASSVISKFFPEFDAYGKACSLSPNNPLYGESPQKIVQIWKQRGDEAANLGTFLHEQIEKFYLGLPYTVTNEFQLFKQFIRDHPKITPYRSEWRIFDDNYNIAGTIDLLSKEGTGFDIYDWKRSRKIIDPYTLNIIKTDPWNNRGIGKLSNIHDTSYNRYCLQQSLYRYILEKNYDLKISNMYLVVLHPLYDKYHLVEVPY